ncbi:hypothetical protein QUF75_15360 [Desulfococcaceae bacterium HSG7]|nr:hypothetical protein [Desulfococcaceae bacterium HSG7]
MNTVIEPSLLFISEEKWYDLEKRDEFLEHLLNHLENITTYNITKIYWSDDLEEMIWNHPQLPPWRTDRDWKLQIVPVIYELFSKCRIIIQDIETDTDCSIIPPFKEICKDEIYELFINLLHFIIKLQENIFLCVGIDNRLQNNAKYLLKSDSTDQSLKPFLINNPDDWLQHVKIIECLWPCSINKGEIDKFRTAINITAKKQLSKESDSDFVYDFEFSKSFLKEVLKESKYRKEVLYGIAKRLSLNQKAASSDKSLNDEPLKGRKDIRRFRVTGSNRIHYRYLGANNIKFLNYYGEGKHDSGL